MYKRFPFTRYYSLSCLHAFIFIPICHLMSRHYSQYNSLTINPDIVTASKDRSVGIYRLGGPSHGCTEYKEVR